MDFVFIWIFYIVIIIFFNLGMRDCSFFMMYVVDGELDFTVRDTMVVLVALAKISGYCIA